MSTKPQTATEIVNRVRQKSALLAADLRNDADALVHTSQRIGMLCRISTGSPNQHSPNDVEALLELLCEEIDVMQTQAESARKRINAACDQLD